MVIIYVGPNPALVCQMNWICGGRQGWLGLATDHSWLLYVVMLVDMLWFESGSYPRRHRILPKYGFNHSIKRCHLLPCLYHSKKATAPIWGEPRWCRKRQHPRVPVKHVNSWADLTPNLWTQRPLRPAWPIWPLSSRLGIEVLLHFLTLCCGWCIHAVGTVGQGLFWDSKCVFFSASCTIYTHSDTQTQTATDIYM